MLNHSDMSPCKLSKSMVAVIAVLTVFVASLGTITIVLSRKVRLLGRRPRIKKRIVVNKSITPLTCRPPQQENQQCEITIENCCNMNICETVRKTRNDSSHYGPYFYVNPCYSSTLNLRRFGLNMSACFVMHRDFVDDFF